MRYRLILQGIGQISGTVDA